LIRRVLDHLKEDAVHRQVRLEVAEVCRSFPIYRYLDQREE